MMVKIIKVFMYICFVTFLSGYTLELPEPLDVNNGTEVSSVEVFVLILSNLVKTNTVLTLPILEDMEYVLYPKDIILKQFSSLPKPNKFGNDEYSNCNHRVNFYKTLSQQTMPGAPCIYISGLKFTKTGFTRHAWLGILSDNGEILMFLLSVWPHPIILKLNAS